MTIALAIAELQFEFNPNILPFFAINSTIRQVYENIKLFEK
jgi:hypothetical protein